MNRFVHFDLTREWALQEGFSDADALAIARADTAVDRVRPVHEGANARFHFAWAGAYFSAGLLYLHARRRRDLVALGEAMHCMQDAIGHGWYLSHWVGIDDWDGRRPAVRARLERLSRRMLRAYRRTCGTLSAGTAD